MCAILSAIGAIDDNILHSRFVNHSLVEGVFLVGHIDILEEKVRQTIFIRSTYIKEILRFHFNIPDIDIITLRHRHILTILRFEKHLDIKKQPEGGSFPEGGQTNIAVTVSGGDAPYTYILYRNGKEYILQLF